MRAGGVTPCSRDRPETEPHASHLCEYLLRTALSLSQGWYVSRKFSLFTRGCRSWALYPL